MNANRRAWRREAILEGPLTRILVRLAWPMMLTGQLQVFVGIVTVFWVGRLLGTDGLGVYVIFRPVSVAVYFLIAGTMESGTRSLIARSVGAADDRGGAIAVAAVQLGVMIAGALALVGSLARGPIAELLAGRLGLADELADYCLPWLALVLPLSVVSQILLATGSAAGWTTFGLFRSIANVVLVAMLIPLFTHVLPLGMAGPMLGTGVCAAIVAWLMWRAVNARRGELGIGPIVAPTGGARRALWKRTVSIGLPDQLGRVVSFAVQAVLVQLAVPDGRSAVAGYGICADVLLVVGGVGFATSSACAIIIGQNLGSGQPERCRKAIVRAALLLGVLAAAFLAVSSLARPIFWLFTDDPTTIDAAMQAMGVMRWGMIGVLSMQLLLASYAATGRTKLAGLIVVSAEAAGLIIAFAVPVPALTAVSLAFVTSNLLKGVALLALLPHAFLRPLAAAAAGRERAGSQSSDSSPSSSN